MGIKTKFFAQKFIMNNDRYLKKIILKMGAFLGLEIIKNNTKPTKIILNKFFYKQCTMRDKVFINTVIKVNNH